MYWLPAILILPYFFMLLKLSRSLSKIKSFSVSSEPGTFVSVIIACRNEERNIPLLLEDLVSQNYPESLFEIIIVNDGSSDRTVEMASACMYAVNMKILDNKGAGKKLALRTGIIAAKGDLIITTDADCRLGKNWIRTIAAFFELNRPDMIIAPVVLNSSTGFLSRIQELEFMSLQGITAGSALSGNPVMCNGANLAFKRIAYLNHIYNLHDEIDSGDDIFLLHSLKTEEQSKIQWLESPDATVITNSSSTLSSFLNQRSRWISKAKSYQDKYTILLGILTFAAICLQISYLIATLIAPDLLLIFLSIMFLKSIPDFFILRNVAGRYGKSKLMWFFLPGQLLYPFYVLSVVVYAMIFRKR